MGVFSLAGDNIWFVLGNPLTKKLALVNWYEPMP